MATRGIDSRTKEEKIRHAIKNALMQDASEYNTIQDCVEVIKEDGLHIFIGKGFIWNDTPEGVKYWEAIYDEIEYDLHI